MNVEHDLPLIGTVSVGLGVAFPATRFRGPSRWHAGTRPGVSEALAVTVGFTFLKIAVFFGLMYVIGLRLFPWLSAQLTLSGSAELATLFATAVAISLAYGAAVLFFLSAGMLLNPAILWTEPLKIPTVLAIFMIGKTLAALGLVLLLRQPLRTALTVSASLTQIGEFFFILVGLGLSLSLLPPEGRDLVLAGAILSITFNPLVFRLSEWIARRQAEEAPAAVAVDRPTVEAPKAALVGYGRVGRIVGKDLTKAGIPFAVVEQNRDTVERLRKRGIPVVSGDASTTDLIAQAPLDRTRLVMLAIPNIHEARRVFDLVKAANPTIDIVVRADNEEEREYFRDHGALEVLIAENELGHSMSRLVTHDARSAA